MLPAASVFDQGS